ncbi:MAG: VanZ family protein [Phycisphaerae bacterium]|nr:VanZ family protein [Phycisphaerae bacterium]
MAHQLRKKLALISVIIYWPTIFLLTHTPLPKIVHQANLSDKSLHFMVYFILVFLLWGTLKPYSKVAWNKPTVWIILAVIVWYGAIDEWLQGYVAGRSADVHDFYADLMGTLTSLVLLSLLSFWPALLAMSAMAIFVVVNSSRADLTQLLPITSTCIAPLLLAGFTGLTLYCVHTSKIAFLNTGKPHFRWLFPTLLPCLLLAVTAVGARLLHRHQAMQDILLSGLAIALTVLMVQSAHKLLKKNRKFGLSQSN